MHREPVQRADRSIVANELQQRHGRVHVALVLGPFLGRVVHVSDAGPVHTGAFHVSLREQDRSRLEVSVGGDD